MDPATFRADRTFFGKFNIKALGIMAIVLRVEKNIEKKSKRTFIALSDTRKTDWNTKGKCVKSEQRSLFICQM